MANSIGMSLNPEAAEFLPAQRLSKRKASASIKKGKTIDWSSKPSAASEYAIIRVKDLGLQDIELRAGTGSESSEDDLPDMLELLPVAQAPRWRSLQRSLTGRNKHLGRTAKGSTGEKSPSRHALMLVSREQRGSLGGLKFLPLSSADIVGLEGCEHDYVVSPRQQERIERMSLPQAQSSITWPVSGLPVEIFELITHYLARDDVKSMRMVSHEFEQKVSRQLFHTSVVPFNTELFDMIDENTKAFIRRSSMLTIKDQPEAGDMSADPSASQSINMKSLHWQNAKEDVDGKVYSGHGLRVFQGFGPYIKRFGMSFEVSEEQLKLAPSKKHLNQVEAYHGAYDWPTSHYTRFAKLAGVESTADETPRIKAAFSSLKVVQELALSVDSGLGWLNGPDKSMHARVFDRPSRVFGNTRDIPDRSAQAASDLWTALQDSQATLGLSGKDVSYGYHEVESRLDDLQGLQSTPYADVDTWLSTGGMSPLSQHLLGEFSQSDVGVLYATCRHDDGNILGACINPKNLKTEQKEWLLESGWAQRAFIESYMLAVMDNINIPNNVTSLNIAKLSSGFLHTLARDEFWSAMPSLEHITLHVSPDWRSVEKDDAGSVVMNSIDPSDAVTLFHDLLRTHISALKSVRNLDVGWVGGGEHAQGLFARNRHILPAPISSKVHSTANSTRNALIFSSVEHLTLTNCWITPPMLQGLVQGHSTMSVQKLTLNSVSVTDLPRLPVGGNAPPQNMVNGAPHMHIQLLNPQPVQMANAQQIFFQAQQQLAQGWQAPHLLTPQQLQQQFAQVQQMIFAQNQLLPAAGPAWQGAPGLPPNVATPHTPQHWARDHREGSWPTLIDSISPGPVLADYFPQPQPWEQPRPSRAITQLHTIEFISCGYAKLPDHTAFQQQAVLQDLWRFEDGFSSKWFRDRFTALQPYMMESKDVLLAKIVQHIPQHDMDALQYAWSLADGWEDRSLAEEAEYNGCLPGGTGRFSGVVSRDMGVGSQVASGH